MNALVPRPEVNLTVEEIENEARILDTQLAAQLGYDRPRVIRELIERNLTELSTYGVCRAVRQTSGPKGGRPSMAYWLNEEQALLICALSDAPKASMVRAQLIRVFTAWRRGDLVEAAPAAPIAPPQPLALSREQQIANALVLAMEVTREVQEQNAMLLQAVDVLKPLARVGETIANHNRSLREWARMMSSSGMNINLNQLYADLAREGYLTKHRKEGYIVSHRGRNVFEVGAHPSDGSREIFANRQGVTVLEALFRAGALTMRSGCIPPQRRLRD